MPSQSFPGFNADGTIRINTDTVRSTMLNALRLNSARGASNTSAFLDVMPVTPSFLMNPNDNSLMDLKRCAYFTDVASPNTPHLEAADHSDFASLTAFTCSFFVNKDNWRDATGETYFAKAGASGNRTLWIHHGSSLKENQDLKVSLYDSSDTESYGQYDYASSETFISRWSHCTVVYDGGGAANDDKLKIYFDGVLQTITHSGTHPATLKTSTEPVSMGRCDAQILWRLQASMSRVCFWNKALTQAAIDEVYNNGYGISCRDLKNHPALSYGLISAWELDEDTADRVDIVSGHDFTCPEADVGSRLHVMRWDDAISGIQFTPATTGKRYPYFARAPIYVDSAAQNLGVQFGQSHAMHALIWGKTSNGPFNETSGEIMQVMKYVSSGTATAEQFPFMIANYKDVAQYHGILFEADESNVFRLRDLAAGYNSTNRSDHNVSFGTTFLNDWVGLGTGGASSFEHYVDTVSQTIGTIGVQDRWFGDQNERTSIGINCLSRSNGIEGNAAANYGTTVVFDSVLSTADRATVSAILNLKHTVY